MTMQKNTMKKGALLLGAIALLAISSTRLWAHTDENASLGSPGARGAGSSQSGDLTDHDTPKALMAQVGVTQKMDAKLPLNATFKDQNGQTRKLGEFFGKKPVMLMFLSFTCTQVCTASLQTLHTTLKELGPSVGKDFDIVVTSIDPRETTTIAKAQYDENVKNYGRKGSESGWHFLTGDEKNVKQLTNAVGVRYAFNPATKEYVHPDCIVFGTPTGHISRYFYNLDYPTRDMKFGLMDASQGKIGSPLEYFALQCFHYNPKLGKYNFAIMGLLRILAIATLLGLVTGIFLMTRGDKKRRRANGEFKAQQV